MHEADREKKVAIKNKLLHPASLQMSPAVVVALRLQTSFEAVILGDFKGLRWSFFVFGPLRKKWPAKGLVPVGTHKH